MGKELIWMKLVARNLWSPGSTCRYHQARALEGPVTEQQFEQLRSPDRQRVGGEGRREENLGCLLARGWQPGRQPAMIK